jgi:hypothetical protein
VRQRERVGDRKSEIGGESETEREREREREDPINGGPAPEEQEVTFGSGSSTGGAIFGGQNRLSARQ